MERKYGVGMVGAGAISPSHLMAYKALKSRLTPVGISDVDEARLRQTGQKAFIPVAVTDYRRLLERTDIDIIDVCTPPGVHAQIVKDALEAGKYVICEKPLAPTLAQVDELIELARRHPGRLSTVFQRRYAGPVQKLMQAKDEGSLGKIVAGDFVRYAKGAFVRAAKSWGSWSMSGGGTVMTQFIHELDLMGLVYGAPASVSATMDTVHLAIESEDTFAATVRFASGAIVGCTSATGVGKSGVSFDVIGTEKIFQYRSAESEEKKAGGLGRYMTLAQKGMRVAGDRVRSALGRPSRPKGDGGTHKPYFDAIVKALDLGQPLPVGPQDARAAVELATGIYTSALLGEPVEFPLGASTPYYRGVTARDYEGRNAPREPQRVAGMAGRQAG